MIGGLGLAAVGVLYTVGHLGEPLRPELSDPPLALHLALRLAGLAFSLAFAVLGVAAALEARRGRGAESD